MTILTLTIIGFILNLILLYLFKNTRLNYYIMEYKDPDVPIMTLGGLIIILLLSWIPFVNIIESIVLFGIWVTNTIMFDDWVLRRSSILDKLIELLKKPIG